jgi:hypothetical protein
MPNGPDDVGDEGLVEEGATQHGGAPPRRLMALNDPDALVTFRTPRVAQVLIELLQGDPNSFLSVELTWKPTEIPAGTAGEFTLADLLTFATR